MQERNRTAMLCCMTLQLDGSAIAQAYQDGQSLRDVAERYGVSPTPIKRILREHNVPLRPPSIRGPDRNPGPRRRADSRWAQDGRGCKFTDDELRDLASRFIAGETQVDLAKRFRCSESTIGRALRTAGIPAGAHGQIREHHHAWRGGRRENPHGYIQVRPESDDEIGQAMKGQNGYVLEHRLVMARHIGRPLTEEETVHHGPGGRHDNRIENLGLWASRHPKGQRVEDLVAFAHEILDLYGDIPFAVATVPVT